jgi:hypothetical protein
MIMAMKERPSEIYVSRTLRDTIRWMKKDKTYDEFLIELIKEKISAAPVLYTTSPKETG